MPNPGDTKYFKIPGFGNDVEYTWFPADADYAEGWWTKAPDPLDYGGNGNEPVAKTPEPSREPAQPPPAPIVGTFNGRSYQYVPPIPAQDASKNADGSTNPGKAAVPGGWKELGPLDKVPVGKDTFEPQPDGSVRVMNGDGTYQTTIAAPRAESKPSQYLKQPDGSTIVVDGDGKFQSHIPASKPTSVNDLIVAALTAPGGPDWQSAMALDDFANRPSQTQRLQLAIQYSQSPADYLSIVGMMRGEIPIGPSGSNYRLGPESQVFGALGVGGQGGQNPLADPASQSYVQNRGGGQQQATGGGNIPVTASVDGQPVGAASQTRMGATPGQDAAFGIDPNIYVDQATAPGSGTATTSQALGQGQGQGQILENRLRQEAGLDATAYFSADTGKQLTPDEIAKIKSTSTGMDALLKSGAVRQGSPGGGTAASGQTQTDMNAQYSPGELQNARIAYNNERNAIDSGAKKYDSAGMADFQQRGKQLGVDPSKGISAQSTLPSYLQQAYGQDILSGQSLKTRMSYPELGAQQGVTIPRFRSAQARSMQTPLEQRLFEAGLKQQGIDVPTYLSQEQQGTTPGGRRQQVQVVSR